MDYLHNHFLGDKITTARPVIRRKRKTVCASVELVSVQETVDKEHNCALFQDFLTDIFGCYFWLHLTLL